MKPFDRRTALKGLGAAAVSPWLLRCGEDPTTSKPLSDTIDNVVVMMMENRSFDHYLGALSLEGRAGIDGLTATMANKNAAGEDILIHRADKRCVADPPHGWTRSHEDWNEGKNDGFVKSHEADRGAEEGHRVMGYYDRETLPNLYRLADEYVVAQRWFASVMGATWPNRFYSHAASSLGQKGNSFAEYSTLWNIYDRMTAAGRSWHIYSGNLSFVVLFEKNYEHEPFRKLNQFFDDAAAGTLPQLSVIEPIYGRNDDHPPAHPVAGQVLISQVYRALAASPQWNRTLFVLTYDECGGFFDHVSPPKTSDERASEGFDQLGFRVPSIIMGPWVKKGHISNTVYEHASIPAFVERLYGLEPLNQRDAAANDFRDVLDMDRIATGAPSPPIQLPVIEADEAELFAPACVASIGPFSLQSTPAVIGQPELEDFYLRNFPKRTLDAMNRDTDREYEALLRRAERDGILRTRR